MQGMSEGYVIVLDQSFASEKLSAHYSKTKLYALVLHFIPKIPQLSFALIDNDEILLESFGKIEEPYIPKEKRGDLDFLRRAIKVNPKIYSRCEILQNDKEATLTAVSLDGMLLSNCAPIFRDDFEIVFKAFLQNPISRQHASYLVYPALRETQEFKDWDIEETKSRTEFTDSFKRKLFQKVRNNPNDIYDYVTGYDGTRLKEPMTENIEIMMECTKIHPPIFKLAHKSIRSNKDLVLKALNISGLLLRYVDESLKNDADIIRTALLQNIHATVYLGEELKTKEILSEFPDAIEFFNESFGSDREIMMQLVKKNGNLLKYADKNLKLDREIVSESIKQNGLSIQYADPTLFRDRELALIAVSQNGNAINYFQKIYSHDRQIIEKALDADGLHLRFATLQLRQGKEIVRKAVSKNGFALRYSCIDLQKDKELVLLALRNDSKAIAFIHKSLWKDEEIVKLAGKHTYRALLLASDEIKANRDIVLPILLKHHNCFDYMDEKLKHDKEFLLTAIHTNCGVFGQLDLNLKQDENFVRRSLERNGLCFNYLDNFQRNNPEFVILACSSSLDHLGEFLIKNTEFRTDPNFIYQCVERNGGALNHFKIDDLDTEHAMSIVKLAVKSAFFIY